MGRGSRFLAPAAAALVAAAVCVSCATTRPLPAGGRDVLGPGYPLDLTVSYHAALFHWVDSLAGTSGGKTIEAYRRQFAVRLGAPTPDVDRRLEAFVALRKRHAAAAPRRLEDGLEIAPPVALLGAFVSTDSLEEAYAKAARDFTPGEAAEFRALLESFRPAFDEVWDGGRIPREFTERFGDPRTRDDIARLLARFAEFFGVDPATMPRPRLVVVPVPGQHGTHSQAVGRQLLIEVRVAENLADQVAVIAHENAHLLWAARGTARNERLAAVAAAAGRRGTNAFLLLHEALPTVLGQGIADRRFNRLGWSPRAPWYHLEDVDAYAKALHPYVEGVLRTGGTFDEAFVRHAVGFYSGP